MKLFKQNILPMILAAVFAIIAAVVEGTFVYDYDVEFKSAAKLTDAASDMNAAPDQPLFLSHETSAAAVLLSRRSGQQTLSRTLRSNFFQGFCGRDGGIFKRFSTLAISRAIFHVLSHNVFPAQFTYQTAKEYYVFTLRRILC